MMTSIKPIAKSIMARITPGKAREKSVLRMQGSDSSEGSAQKGGDLFGEEYSLPLVMPDPDSSESDNGMDLDLDLDLDLESYSENNAETESDGDSVGKMLEEHDRAEDARLFREKEQAGEQRQEIAQRQKNKDANQVLACVTHLAATRG
jgi:hypothetical protein